MRAGELTRGDTGSLQVLAVGLDPLAQGGEPVRGAPLKSPVRAHHLLHPGDPVGLLGGSGRRLVVPERLHDPQQPERLAVIGLHDLRAQRRGESLGQRADRQLRLAPVERGAILDGNRRPHQHERPARPEGARLVEHEPDRQQRDRPRPAGRQRHPRRARPERQQPRLGLRASLGEEQHGAPVGEGGRDGVEHRVVPRGVADALLTAQHRQRAHQPQQGAHHGISKERRRGQDQERPGHRRHHEHRIHERVVVIRGDDDRAPGGDVLAADEFHAPVEQPEQEPGERADDPVSHGSSEIGARLMPAVQAPEHARLAPVRRSRLDMG